MHGSRNGTSGNFLMGYPIWFRVLRPKNRILLVLAEDLLLHLSALLLLHLQPVDEHLETVGGEHSVVVHLDQPSRLPDINWKLDFEGKKTDTCNSFVSTAEPGGT